MARAWLIWMTAAALACGCSRPAPQAAPAAARTAADEGYATPPEPRSVRAAPDGGVVLSGVARPDSLIRLASPDGSALGAAASHAGLWNLVLPAGPQPRLYSLSEDVGGRPLRALGYVAVLPSASGAAMLRPGAAALPVSHGARPAISGLDFDSSGAAVVSGWAAPNEPVRLQVDAADAGEDQTDASGRFVHSLPQPLRPGVHTLIAHAKAGTAAATVEVSPASPIRGAPFAAARSGRGWRIDWVTPGGGVQSTLLLDAGAAG